MAAKKYIETLRRLLEADGWCYRQNMDTLLETVRPRVTFKNPETLGPIYLYEFLKDTLSWPVLELWTTEYAKAEDEGSFTMQRESDELCIYFDSDGIDFPVEIYKSANGMDGWELKFDNDIWPMVQIIRDCGDGRFPTKPLHKHIKTPVYLSPEAFYTSFLRSRPK